MRAPVGLALLMTAVSLGQQKIAEFTLTDPRGGQVAISPGRGDVTVVLFISTICPVSNNYNTRMNDLYRDYSPKGVKFVFVNANQNESAAEVAEYLSTAPATVASWPTMPRAPSCRRLSRSSATSTRPTTSLPTVSCS